MKSINPLDGKVLREYKSFSDDKVDQILHRSQQAYLEWSQTDLSYRSTLLLNLKEQLLKNKNELANLMAKEMGKPIKEGVSEIEKCAWVCEYYAQHGEEFLRPKSIETDYEKSEVHYCSVGTILAIMPWNFPFWQVFRFLAPNLMAGNTALLKHASNVSTCSLEIEKIVKQASFPEGVFRSLLIDNSQVEKIIANPNIRGVTLTGSTAAGKSVAKVAGSHLKKTVLELGGSDPYIILADANIKKAAMLCAKSRLINGGQSCIAAKRFIVLEGVFDAFISELKEQMQSKIIGDPLSSQTQIGPMARFDLRDELYEQVKKSIELGCKCVLGGQTPKGEGAFFEPTILTDVTKEMPAYSEELFGPVAVVIKVKSIEEAVQVANETSFGLGAGIFSENKKLAYELASSRIDAGACFINDFVKSDPRLPFGGVKESGYGRELGSFGIYEFVNIKTICLN